MKPFRDFDLSAYRLGQRRETCIILSVWAYRLRYALPVTPLDGG